MRRSLFCGHSGCGREGVFGIFAASGGLFGAGVLCLSFAGLGAAFAAAGSALFAAGLSSFLLPAAGILLLSAVGSAVPVFFCRREEVFAAYAGGKRYGRKQKPGGAAEGSARLVQKPYGKQQLHKGKQQGLQQPIDIRIVCPAPGCGRRRPVPGSGNIFCRCMQRCMEMSRSGNIFIATYQDGNRFISG